MTTVSTSTSSATNAAVPAFEMRNVTVTTLRDASVVVLEQVNWTVDVGDFWAVAGLLRSGKSDLLALAAGISRPTRGVHHLFGADDLEQVRAYAAADFNDSDKLGKGQAMVDRLSWVLRAS